MQELDDVFQIVLIITFMACAVLFLIKIKKVEASAQRPFFIGLFGFCLGWSLLELLYFISGLYLLDSPLNLTYYKTAYLFGIGALLSIELVIEKYAVPKTKFIFSIVTIIGLVLVIILPMPPQSEITAARLASYIFLPAGAGSILILYIYLLFKLTGSLRRETGLILLGFVLIFLGYVLTTTLFESFAILSEPYWSVLCYTLMMVGGVLLTLIYYRKEI